MEVWRSYFESLLGSEIEQGELDTGGETEVLRPLVCNGDNFQSDLSSQLDMPIYILQDEVDLAFSRVKKEAALGKDGISFQMMSADVHRDLWLALFGVCWKSGEAWWFRFPRRWWRVCVADRFRGIALTSVVCKVFCHILKERLATVVEEYNLVLEEQT